MARQGETQTSSGGVNPHDNVGDKAQKPEARDQISSLREDTRAVRSFDCEFWPRYPNKVGRVAALRSFEKLHRDLKGDISAIIAGLERYIRNKPPDRPWLNPATFLNQRRFEDEPAVLARASSTRPSPHSSPFIQAAQQVSADEHNDITVFPTARITAEDRDRDSESAIYPRAWDDAT